MSRMCEVLNALCVDVRRWRHRMSRRDAFMGTVLTTFISPSKNVKNWKLRGGCTFLFRGLSFAFFPSRRSPSVVRSVPTAARIRSSAMSSLILLRRMTAGRGASIDGLSAFKWRDELEANQMVTVDMLSLGSETHAPASASCRTCVLCTYL